jgi:hypothetical protein
MAAITNVAVTTDTVITASTDAGNMPVVLFNNSDVDVELTFADSGGDTYTLHGRETLENVPARSNITGTAAAGTVEVIVLRGVHPGEVVRGESAADPLYVSDVAVPVEYAMGTPAIKATVTVGATTTVILAANSARTHAIVKSQATNTEPLYLAIGEAAVQNNGISLDPGETMQIGPFDHTTLAINGICASGGMLANVWEA